MYFGDRLESYWGEEWEEGTREIPDKNIVLSSRCHDTEAETDIYIERETETEIKNVKYYVTQCAFFNYNCYYYWCTIIL